MDYASLVSSVVVGSFSAGLTFGFYRRSVQDHEKRIEKIEAGTQTKEACLLAHAGLAKYLDDRNAQEAALAAEVHRMSNATRWMLTDTEHGFGLSLTEANDVLENGG